MGAHSSSHPTGNPTGHGHDTIQVEPLDPLHDIDGKKTLTWVVVFMVMVFGGMWLLAVTFGFVLEQQHQTKIYDRETVELNELRAREREELAASKDNGDGTVRLSIEEAMRRLAEK